MSYLANFHHQITGPVGGRQWVFLHGLMGYSLNWRRIIMEIEKTERVLVYDQRGHGRSFQPEFGYAPEDYAMDLYKITQEIGWENFVLVGHSMGGRNSLCFSHLYPEKLRLLVIEDMGPENSTLALPYYEKLLGCVPTPFTSRALAKDFFQNEFPKKMKFNESPEVLGQFLFANLEEKTTGLTDWKFSKEGVLESVREGALKDRWGEVQSLACPTLLIRGENSSVLKRETYQKMLELNPLIEGHEVAGAGHWIHSERPLEFIKLLQDFQRKN